MANQDLLDKTFSAIKDIIDFYEENCFKDDFTELIGQIKPKEDDFTFNNFIKSIFMGDVFSCIAGIGGKLDMKEPPCVIIPMLSLKLESNTDLKNSIQFASINKDFFDSCQGLMDSIMDIRNAIGNYETFVISDIFSYYNKEKQVKYIDLMIRLCRCLIEFKNNNPSESMAFIKHLYQIQKINKGILADEK